MGLYINTNISSITAQRNFSVTTAKLNKSFEKLSTGYRINRASDDAAGLQISEALRSQIRGVQQAQNNTQEGLNLLSVAEGALGTIQEDLQRIRELTVQAANDTLSTSQRSAIEDEINARIEDITQISDATEYNDIKLLSTSAPAELLIQVGANDTAADDTIDIASALGDATATTLGLDAVDVSSNAAALDFLESVDDALVALGSRRTLVGNYQNRLDSSFSNLTVAEENYSAAESRIRNVDIAKETANMTRLQILQQAGALILSQANQSASIALTLLS